MKKFLRHNLLLGLCLLSIGLFLSGCSTTQTSQNEDKSPQQEDTPAPTASIAAQIQQLCANAQAEQDDPDSEFVELTPEICQQFFDLAQLERWDFLPNFGYDGAELPTDMSDYIFMVIAQSLVWENYYSIDQEQTPKKLSTEYVDEFLRERFGITPAHPEPGEAFDGNVAYKGLEFDGEYYSSATEWAYPPLYGLSLLKIEEDDDQHTIYEARFLEYIAEDGENARELVCNLQPDKPGLTATFQLQVRFYFNDKGIPVYLAAKS